MAYAKKEMKADIREFNRATKKTGGWMKVYVPEEFIDLLEDKIFGGCKSKNVKITWEELEE